MAISLTLKTGDTYPPLEATLKDESGPLDLTNASEVKVIGKSGSHRFERACSVVNAKAGTVKYEWVAADTENAGTFAVEFKIKWNTGKIQTVPNKSVDEIQIETAQ